MQRLSLPYNVLMSLIDSLKDFIAGLFSKDPESAQKRAELRKCHAMVTERHPPYFRARQDLVLPGFAEAILAFARLLRPLAEVARATVASPDARAAQHFFDFIIEGRLSQLSRERRASFSYEGMSDRLRNSLEGDDEFEIIDRELRVYLQELEGIGARRINEELGSIDRFIDVIRYDYERLLAMFDPGVSLENASRRPEFSPIDGEQAFPEILDLYYVLEDFAFTPHLRENLLRLVERRAGSAIDASRRKKVEKLVGQLDAAMTGPLSSWLILALLRSIKNDPNYLPSTPREKRDYFGAYKKRLSQQYEKDRNRLDRERHEDAVTSDLGSLFGTSDIEVIDGYDEDTDNFLRRGSPDGFLWIKPIRVLKTFVNSVFEPVMKDPLKRLLVEGYFENKVFQNNMANVLYQCERSGARIVDFETQLLGSGRISITSVKRYVEEMRRGKDIGSFLTRIVDAINGRAREIVEEEAGLFLLLGGAVAEIISDSKRTSPEVVTNLRTLGGGRNKEIMAQIAVANEKTTILAKIMKNYSIVRPADDGAWARNETLNVGEKPPTA